MCQTSRASVEVLLLGKQSSRAQLGQVIHKKRSYKKLEPQRFITFIFLYGSGNQICYGVRENYC